MYIYRSTATVTSQFPWPGGSSSDINGRMCWQRPDDFVLDVNKKLDGDHHNERS